MNLEHHSRNSIMIVLNFACRNRASNDQGLGTGKVAIHHRMNRQKRNSRYWIRYYDTELENLALACEQQELEHYDGSSSRIQRSDSGQWIWNVQSTENPRLFSRVSSSTPNWNFVLEHKGASRWRLLSYLCLWRGVSFIITSLNLPFIFDHAR